MRTESGSAMNHDAQPITIPDSKTEQLLALDAAMQKLSTAERDILVARFFQSHTAREVSEHWQISEADEKGIGA